MITRAKVPTSGPGICKKCGRAMLRGFTALCLCMLSIAHPGAHPHNEAYTPMPMTQIVSMVTTSSTSAPPIELNGQTYRLS